MSGAPAPVAEHLPVARVLVDISLPHLDRPFDYLVPQRFNAQVVAGSRVRVRFAGRLLDGICLERLAASEHGGRLAMLHAAVSSEAVLTPEVLDLCRRVAERYAGSLSDVVRFAVPPRHARAEAALPAVIEVPDPCDPPDGVLTEYTGGPALVQRIVDGSGPRAVWNLGPHASGVADLAVLAQAAWAGGGSGILVVPDARDLERLAAAVRAVVPADAVTVLSADLGPQRRYAAFLQILRSPRRIVLGVRGAAFAPVRDLRLLACWDDGDDVLASPQAPYWHAREVLALRAHSSGAALVLAGYARSAEAQQLVAAGWARSVVPRRTSVTAPRVVGALEDRARRREAAVVVARVPHAAWEAARTALEQGPVLVHVARAGYVRGLSCDSCRAPLRCSECSGPLHLSASDGSTGCDWCGARHGSPRCRECGGTRVRAGAIGSERTAHELGRALPGVPVLRSDAQHVIAEVDAEPAIVVATAGAEPACARGYAAVLLLDAVSELERPALRSAEEALRRWMQAAALARPGAPVVITADLGIPAVQALLRWDAPWFAERELTERASAGLPPAVRAVSVSGSATAVRELLAAAALPEFARVLGPAPLARGAGERALITVARRQAASLTRGLRAAVVTASARGAPAVEVRVDPVL